MTDLTLEVGAVAHGGHCVARHDGRVVFVRHTLPGETVRATVTEGAVGDRFWRADAVEILEASKDRVESVWPEAGPGGVGGGELAHVALAAQRDWKLAVLREAFERFAGVEFTGVVSPAPSDDPREADGADGSAGLGYRTRVSAVADASGRAAMHLHRSDEVRPLAAMPLAVGDVEAALLRVRAPAGARIDVAQSAAGGEVRVHVNGSPWRTNAPDRRPNAPTALAETVTIDGHSWSFRVPVAGFWQVHRDAPAVLVGEVVAGIGDSIATGGRVADLYGGAGLFALPIADRGAEVITVEADATASRAARRNLHAHPHARVVRGDVRETLREGTGPVDAVVLDPPRSGAGGATIAALGELQSTVVVYVACDPVALARDTALLASHGYALERATAWDLFPMTHHVETVAVFRLR